MAVGRPVAVICGSCGRRDLISQSSRCIGCGASDSDRITRGRLRVLLAIDACGPGDAPVRIEPAMRLWFLSHHLITRLGERTPPAAERRRRRPDVRFVWTEKCRDILSRDAVGQISLSEIR